MRKIFADLRQEGDRIITMREFFYGWYLKCQSKAQTLAVIPAIHQAEGKRTCSVQIITEDDAWTVEFPAEAFHKNGQTLAIGDSRFGEKGIRLAIRRPDLTAKGKLTFGTLSPLKYDIMGPFSFVPFLECRHSVWSMCHSVRGTVQINGRTYSFPDAWGYWEGDRGHSFPREYIWTQCCFSGSSLMLSVADIPIAGFHFRGIIGVVLWHGREYRIATYLGARTARIGNGTVRVIQGDLQLEVRMLDRKKRALRAPLKGKMVRTIHESAACHARYRFRKGVTTVFDFETDRASFEYEYPF